MLNYLFYRIGQFIAMHLPLKITYRIATFCSDLHYMVANKDRKYVKENLKAIFPEKSNREIRRIRITMARNFAKYLVDFFRFEKLDKEYTRKNVHIENINYFDEAISRGKGVIALSAHLGNWELGGVVVALLGYPFWIVALPHKEKKVNDFFNFQRESKGIKVIPLGKAARKSLDILKENGLLALAADKDFTGKGVIMDFFGKPAIFPTGPAALSLKTGASIVPGFMLRNSDDTFTLRIEKPIEFTSTGNKELDMKGLMRQYIKIFEGYICKYPDQWYMFKRFWVS